MSDIGSTVTAAREAQLRWVREGIKTRLQVLKAFRQALVREAGALAEKHRAGRPLAEVLASEILPLAEACRFLEKRAASILRERKIGIGGRPWWLAGVRSKIHREPFGVVLVIAPSNYPLFLPGVQVLQALVAGNGVLLKPGTGGLQCSLDLARLLFKSGLPVDLLAVLSESPQAAQAAIAARPDKVVFTGGFKTGTNVLLQASARLIPATLELSGCDAVYVRKDADVELATRAIAFGLRLNSGRTCIAPKRAYVARSVATHFEGLLAARLAQIPSNPFPANLTAQLLPLLREALAGGAHLLAGTAAEDQVLGPVAIAGIQPDCELAKESFFAPVLSVVTVQGDEEAISRMNDNPYALGGTIFTRNLSKGRSLAAAVNAGVVVVNDLIAPTADPRLPFGGRGRSGFGVTRGAEGLLEMTRPKTVIVRDGADPRHLKDPQPGDADIIHSILTLTHAQGIRAKFHAVRRLAQSVLRNIVTQP